MTLTVSSAHGFRKGDLIAISTVAGPNCTGRYFVAGVLSETVLKIRQSRWYERLWWRIKAALRSAVAWLEAHDA